MKSDKEIINTFVDAILNVDAEVEVDHNTPEADYKSICPFCRERTEGYRFIYDMRHDSDCAYLLAKQIKNETTT